MKRATLGLIIGAISLGAPYANAQLEEVLVSATRRAESIQDVPVSVTTADAEFIAKLGIVDMEDLSLTVPNFEINSSAVIPNLYMRGLGGGTSHSIEQSVGRFLDDVYIGRAVMNLHPFMDIASVEVLRGPQGTLFGKNTAAGALIMRTANPTEAFEAGVNLSYGEFDTTGGATQFDGYISGALSDNLAGRLAVLYRDREGFYRNFLDGPDGAQREDYGLMGKLRYDVSDSTVVGLKVQYMEYEEDGSDTAEMNTVGISEEFWEGLAVASGVPAEDAAQFSAGLDWNVFYNCADALAAPPNGSVPIGSFCPSRDQDSTNVTFDIETQFSAGSGKLIVAYQDYDYTHKFQALEQGLANTFRATRSEQFEGVSVETRFTSNESDSFDYIIGAYYETSELSRNQFSDLNIPFGPGTFIRQHEPWNQDTETFAVFGQLRFFLTEKLTAILGGRWSAEEKDFEFERFLSQYGTDNFVAQDIALRQESRDESRFTPSATLQYDVNDNVNVYGSLARGHKTGGFSDRVDTQGIDIEFDEEIIDSFELGLKSTFLDGSMSLNVALFVMDIEGLQLSTQIPGGIAEFVVRNAADSTSQGLEVEYNWAINDNWSLGGNYAYLDATYDEFLGLDNCPPEYLLPEGGCDLSGAPLQYAPENKLYAYLEYFTPGAIAGWGFGARADFTYTDDQYTDVSLLDFAFQEAYDVYGASARLISPEENITISLIGRNLGNERINAWSVQAGPNSLSAMAAPRSLTLQVKWDFF